MAHYISQAECDLLRKHHQLEKRNPLCTAGKREQRAVHDLLLYFVAENSRSLSDNFSLNPEAQAENCQGPFFLQRALRDVTATVVTRLHAGNPAATNHAFTLLLAAVCAVASQRACINRRINVSTTCICREHLDK